MSSYITDEGLVLKKMSYRDNKQLISIFSKSNGKVIVSAYGAMKPTSKKISHLETGNVIKFSCHERHEYLYLHETDLLYAHSAIKEDENKLDVMFSMFLILDKIVPEFQEEEDMYQSTLNFLRRLHNGNMTQKDTQQYFVDLLEIGGYIDPAKPHFPLEDIQKHIPKLLRGQVM